MNRGRVSFLTTTLTLLGPAMAWAQEAAEVVHEVHEEGGSSMPQLDPTYYASQLFWLVISALIMYVLMAKVALPRVARMIELRDDQVRRDLAMAARLRHEAEDIKVSYTRALRDADERARSLIERTTESIREKQTQALTLSTAELNQKITTSEENIRQEKAAVVTEVPAIAEKLSASVIQELKAKAA